MLVMEANPWLIDRLGPTLPPGSPDLSLPTAATAVAGPTSPQAGVPVPDVVDQLRVVEHRKAARLWCIGVHGGAGETTLSQLITGARPAGHGWPRVAQLTYDGPPRVVLVCRSNASGLCAAQNAATQWAAGAMYPAAVELLALVVMADAPGRLPRPLKDFMALVAGGVPRAFFLPWVELWRFGEPPSAENAPPRARRVVAQIDALLPPLWHATRTPNKREE